MTISWQLGLNYLSMQNSPTWGEFCPQFQLRYLSCCSIFSKTLVSVRQKESVLRHLCDVFIRLLTGFPGYLLPGFVSWGFFLESSYRKKSLPWAHCWWKTKIQRKAFSTHFFLSTAVLQSPPAGPVPLQPLSTTLICIELFAHILLLARVSVKHITPTAPQ